MSGWRATLRRRAGRRSRPLVDDVRRRHPRLREAVAADLDLALVQRGEDPLDGTTLDLVAAALRVAWQSDAFGALCWYRLKAACQRRRVPVVPRVAHHAAIRRAGLCIGDPVLVEPGVVLPHGQVVVDGFSVVGTGARLRPFVVIGLREGELRGPTLGPGVRVGAGATVLGPVVIGRGATIGAGAVVLDDVPEGATVVGAPARPVASTGPAPDPA